MKNHATASYYMITLSYWEILKRRNNSEYKTEDIRVLGDGNFDTASM